MKKRNDLRQYWNWTTERDREIIEAIEEAGSYRTAAEDLGINPRSVERAMAAMKKRAAKQGFSPEHDMTHTAPDGFKIKGTTTLYHAEKGVLMEYVMRREDAERQEELIKEIVDGWCAAARGVIAPVDPPIMCIDSLMTYYPMGDPHFGMYSWAAETGADFNLKIAEQDLMAAVDYLVGQAPPTRRAAMINLGDFFHYDSMESVTPSHRHILDADTRPQEMIDVGVRALRRALHRMLEKHEIVEVINAPGNHDPTLSRAMNTLFKNVYENEPRVIVRDEPTDRYYIEHGRCLVGVIHGQKTKDDALPGIMAAERAEQWGRTRHRYFWRGHDHHDWRKEYNGCIVEHFRTLAAADAFAVGAGYLSGRDMKGIVLHEDFGEVARFTCGIDMLRSMNRNDK